MKANVKSLLDLCVDCVTDNLTLLSTHSPGRQDVVCSGYDQVLPNDVADKLLCRLSENGKLRDSTLLSTFQAKRIRLRHVQIPDASNITVNGLSTLKSHRLSSLTLRDFFWFSLNDILSCLGSQSWKSLQCLRCTSAREYLACCPFCPLSGGHTRKLFQRFVNIRVLAFVNMKLSDSSLHIIAESLPNLQHLDISRNEDIFDISPLCDVQLQTLILYDLHNLAADITVDTLQQLNSLEKLDVSLRPVYADCPGGFGFWKNVKTDRSSLLINMLLEYPSSNLKLTYLDLSGRGAVSQEVLRTYLEEHPSLDFLGLWGTQACGYSMFDVKSKDYIPGIDVSGNASLDQYVVSLRSYQSRDRDIVTCLAGAVWGNRTSCTMTSRNDEILKSLLEIIPTHVLEMVPAHFFCDDDDWKQTYVILLCLACQLTDRRVSCIEDDTLRRILRTCHCLQKRENNTILYTGIKDLAVEMSSTCQKMLKTV